MSKKVKPRENSTSIRIKSPGIEPIDFENIGKFALYTVPFDDPRGGSEATIQGMTPQDIINLGNYLVKVGQAASMGKRIDDIKLDPYTPPKGIGSKIIAPPKGMSV